MLEGEPREDILDKVRPVQSERDGKGHDSARGVREDTRSQEGSRVQAIRPEDPFLPAYEPPLPAPSQSDERVTEPFRRIVDLLFLLELIPHALYTSDPCLRVKIKLGELDVAGDVRGRGRA